MTKATMTTRQKKERASKKSGNILQADKLED